MRQGFSPLKSYSKSIFLILAFGVLTLIFCTKSIPDSHFSWSGPEGSEVYADVDLVQKTPSDLQFYTLKDELYTGELTLYVQENDQLYSKYTFENGILIGGIIFDETGNQSSRFQSDFENGVRVGFRNYDAHDQILLGWARTTEPGDSLTLMREWYPNGQLKFEMTSYSGEERPMIYEGLMTLYDEQGNVLQQELYENGVIAEKIK